MNRRPSSHTSKPAGSQLAGPPSADLASSADFGVSDETARPSALAGDAGSVDGGGVRRASAEGRKPLRGGSGAAPPTGAPPGAPSSLDTLATTRPARERSVRGEAWLREVGDATSKHRSDKARALRAKSSAKVRDARREGFSESYAAGSGEWHRSRARAQEERIERVLSCGADVLEIRCLGCERTHERRLGCRVGLLCVSCRKVIASGKRVRFLASRSVVLGEAAARGLLNPHRRGGRWSEKLLTLTAPHVAEDTIASRIHRVATAWPRFLRKLNAHFRDVGAATSSRFFRCLEWTPGDDGLGHPHIHLWIFSPFLDKPSVEGWWLDALREAGLDELTRIVLDLREISNPRGAASEIIKYLTKDIDASGEKVPPNVYGLVYEAFDGRRVTQSSSGFMGLGKRTESCECGSTLPKRVRKKAASEAPSERDAP